MNLSEQTIHFIFKTWPSPKRHSYYGWVIQGMTFMRLAASVNLDSQSAFAAQSTKVGLPLPLPRRHHRQPDERAFDKGHFRRALCRRAQLQVGFGQ